MTEKEEIMERFNALEENQKYDFREYIMFCLCHLGRDEPAQAVYDAYRHQADQ